MLVLDSLNRNNFLLRCFLPKCLTLLCLYQAEDADQEAEVEAILVVLEALEAGQTVEREHIPLLDMEAGEQKVDRDAADHVLLHPS